MDAHEKLVWDAEISAAVLGKADEFVMIPLTDDPIPEDVKLNAIRHGLAYVGVMGYQGRAIP